MKEIPTLVVVSALLPGILLSQRSDAAAVAARPWAASAGGSPIRVVDWRTAEPLPEALLIAIPYGSLRGGIVSEDKSTRAAMLTAAARSGTRIRLDAAGLGVRPPDQTVIAVHGEHFAIAYDPVVSPAPDTTVTLQCVDASGHPVAGHRILGLPSDTDGVIQVPIQPNMLARTRYLIAGQRSHGAWGMINPGDAVIDLRAAGVDRVHEVRCEPSGTLELVGMHDGTAEDLGAISVQWRKPFDMNLDCISESAAAAVQLRGMHVGVPITVFVRGKMVAKATLHAGETKRIEVEVPAPEPQLRYRLVDDQGRPLHATRSQSPLDRLGEDGSTLTVTPGRYDIVVRLTDADGEAWSCEPITPPRVDWEGVRDDGDLILQRDATTLYCRGCVVDPSGRPVSTSIALTDGCGIFASTRSDSEGRFELHVGRWFRGPLPVGVPRGRPLQTRPIARGELDVRVEVPAGVTAPPRLTGCLQGVDPFASFDDVLLETKQAGSGRDCSWTCLRQGGAFVAALAPGRYDVCVRIENGPTLLQATGIEVGESGAFAPAALQQPLPASHRVCALRLVDRDGHPLPVPGLTRDARAVLHKVVPVTGTRLVLPEILQAVDLKDDRELVLDPVLADVEVAGLPADSRWFFGLSVAVPGAESKACIGELADGRGRMFVPRDVPLVARLHACCYDTNGTLLPVAVSPPALEHFAGEFRVAAAGEVACVRFRAPMDLERQLDAIVAGSRSR